ncbi:MAG: glycerol kinase GlpK [Acidimicrobiia bacterium]|nr:glycerol kinase GlpK [Acidimicrobiia bacterium]
MYVGAIDQGTTSTRFVVVDEAGSIVAIDQMEHRQIQPRPGWVEHDAAEIWANTERVIAGGLAKAGIDRSQLAAVGITNQRETTLLWDAETGEPVHNAIVWQDTRTDRLVDVIGGDAGPDRLRAITGLPLATYFAGPKARWLLDEDDDLARRAASGQLRFGTMDSWVLWKLTGRHVTDVTNASRTLLMDLRSLSWSDEAIDAVGVPADMLPEIVPSVGVIGTGTGVLEGVPISGVLGDQQSALFGQTCFTPGEAKNTYGTGCFMLLNTGTDPIDSDQGLLTTLGYQIGSEPPVYALEGSVAIAGAAVQWLRDNLRVISSADEVEELATSVDDHGGVYFVPAFSGLFAPYWRSDARGAIVGLTRYAEAGHLARATLEAVAFQTRDVLDAMHADSGVDLSALKVDGGMVVNETLMQFQADILGVPVIRPTITESTALGAAYAAGLAIGFWGGLDELAEHWSEDRRFEPDLDVVVREQRHAEWKKAVTRTLDWA